MARLLIISNGHGEDFIAARLADALTARLPELQILAFPLVGQGEQLRNAGLKVVGPVKTMPSGGLTLHHPSFLWRDLTAGLISLTLRQFAYLRRCRPDAVLVVGDVYAQMHATQVRAPRRVMQPLVSVFHHLEFENRQYALGPGSEDSLKDGHGAAPPAMRPEPGQAKRSPLRFFMERFRGPELFLLKQANRVYARDAATAMYLRQLGVADCWYLGNPMMDGLNAPSLQPELEQAGQAGAPVVALLPGTRAQAAKSVSTMLGALRGVDGAVGLVAWTHDQVPEVMAGWRQSQASLPSVDGLREVWTSADGNQQVWWLQGRFASVLRSAQAAIGTSGTANEQAVGLGLPVVSFEVPPLFSREFLSNQKRLLGSGLLVGQPDPELLGELLKQALFDQSIRTEAAEIGKERMGGPGASAALADDLAEWLNEIDGVPAPEAAVAPVPSRGPTAGR